MKGSQEKITRLSKRSPLESGRRQKFRDDSEQHEPIAGSKARRSGASGRNPTHYSTPNNTVEAREVPIGAELVNPSSVRRALAACFPIRAGECLSTLTRITLPRAERAIPQ